MNNKICVYAISKNESQNIDRWLDSMQEADYIVVLDTGSTDDTVERLKADSRVTRVEQQIITPWRFDVARNESMKLVPEDANIMVCTDFDEFFEEGWAQILRDNWREDDNRCYYTYAWSHNDIGEPQDVFKYDKIHDRNFHWVFPVHEVLVPINPDFESNVLEAGEAIYLHHLQDKSKDRKSYFDLLKLSVKENKNDSHCRMLLAREYIVKNDLDNALKEYKKCLAMPDIEDPNKFLVKLETLIKIADIYKELGDYDNAIVYYHKFLNIDSTYREPYFCLAEIYNEQGLYHMAKAMVEIALKVTTQKFTWVERSDSWIAHSDEILSISEYYLGNYTEAIEHGRIALSHNPENVRLMKNYISYLETFYNKEKQN